MFAGRPSGTLTRNRRKRSAEIRFKIAEPDPALSPEANTIKQLVEQPERELNVLAPLLPLLFLVLVIELNPPLRLVKFRLPG